MALAQAATTIIATNVSSLRAILHAMPLQWALATMSWAVQWAIQDFLGAVLVTGATACMMALTHALRRTI